MLIVLESTTYPGTTEELVQPMLDKGGLKAGGDLFLAFSPERVDPGNGTFHTRNVPKVVGGTSPECCQLAAALYSTAVDTLVPVSSPRVAEMAMLLQSVPIDPFYLAWNAKQNAFDPRFIELAGHINGAMPHLVVAKVSEALNARRKSLNGSRVLISGLAYKRDIDDIRESPALDVLGLLHERGAVISYSDPFIPSIQAGWSRGKEALQSTPLRLAVGGDVDVVVIITDHSKIDYCALAAAASLLADSHNAISAALPHVFRLGAPRPVAAEADALVIAD
jgi:UDP-N-acetyl-D-glucosamine dehydrogenase